MVAKNTVTSPPVMTGQKYPPDGRFVAFQEYNSRFVYVYSFETAELWTSEPYMQEDDVRDRVLGWDSNNQLYISRHFGNCDFSKMSQ